MDFEMKGKAVGSQDSRKSNRSVEVDNCADNSGGVGNCDSCVGSLSGCGTFLTDYFGMNI